MDHEQQIEHKPLWLRTFADQTTVPIVNILLYDFTLTNKGMLRKATRDYLKEKLVNGNTVRKTAE